MLPEHSRVPISAHHKRDPPIPQHTSLLPALFEQGQVVKLGIIKYVDHSEFDSWELTLKLKNGYTPITFYEKQGDH